LGAEYEKNRGYGDENDNPDYEEKHDAIKSGMKLDKTFEEDWKSAREEFLGEPEFAMESSGWRYSICERDIDSTLT